MSSDERTILEHCRAGNLAEFSVLYDRYVTDVFRFVYFKTHHKETAEDITSQSFIKALEHIGGYDDAKGPFKAWLFSIARNTVIDHYRSRKEHLDVEDIWDLANDEDVLRDVAARMQLSKVQEYMKELTGEQRDIVMLRVWQGLSYQEIAQIMGKSEGSCKMMFSRTVAKMRKDILIALLLFISQL